MSLSSSSFMSSESAASKGISERAIVRFHILAWSFLTLVFGMIGSEFYTFTEVFWRWLIGMLGVIPLVYLNIYGLIPAFFEKRRYVLYGLSLAGLLLLATVLRVVLLQQVHIDTRFLISKISQEVGVPVGVILVTNLLAVIGSLLYHLTLSWLEHQEMKNRLRSEKLEAELKLLKSQVHPHFLFNVLNNLYTLCFLQDERAAPTVMKLSEMMRYILYEANAKRVTLEKEWHFLQHYADLQSLKNTGTDQVSLTAKGALSRFHIAPLLLLPLLENAFKHGNLHTDPEGWIELVLAAETPYNLHVTVRNSYSPKEKSVTTLSEGQVPPSGIGLENVRKRLALLYPELHTFQVESTPTIFSVTLTLALA